MTHFGGPGGVSVQSNNGAAHLASDINFDSGFTITYVGNVPTITYNGSTPPSPGPATTNFETLYNPSNPTYGALGDGSSDDFTALQNCANAALASGARAMYLPTLYYTSRALSFPVAQDFKIPYVASVNTATGLFTFSLQHGFFDGEPIMIQGSNPTGSFSGHVYYIGATGQSNTSVVGALYDNPVHARAGGSTGRVVLTQNVTTTGSITGGTSTLVVAAEHNDQKGTNVVIAGASGASGGFYIIDGVGTLTLTLNTTASATVSGGVVTFVSWIDWRFFKDGFKFIAAPGGGLAKHHTWNTTVQASLISMAVGSNILIQSMKFVGLSSGFVPAGVLATTTNGSKTVTVNVTNTDWAVPGLPVLISGASADTATSANGLLFVESAVGSTLTMVDNVVGTVMSAPLGGQISSGIIGTRGTGTSGSNTLNVTTTDGLFNGFTFRLSGITGTYTVTGIVGLALTVSPVLAGNASSTLFIPTGANQYGDDGVRVGSCWNVMVQNCQFHHLGDAAFRAQTNTGDYSALQPDGDINAGVNTGAILFFKNYVFNCYQTSTTSNDYVHGGARDIWFVDNYFDTMRGSCKFASRTQGAKNLYFHGNTINRSDNHGVELYSYDNVSIDRNVIQNIANQGIFFVTSDTPAGGYGLGTVGFASDGLRVTSNVFDNVGFAQGTLACLRLDLDHFADGTLFDYKGVVFRDNLIKNITNTSHYVINFASGSFVNVDISRNILQNYNGSDFVHATLRSSLTAGFINGWSIRQNKLPMNNAAANSISIQGTVGTSSVPTQINEIDISDNLITGICARGLLLESCRNVRVKNNRMNLIGVSYYLTNNQFGYDTVSNLTFDGNDFETTATFGMSLSAITGLIVRNNRFTIATGSSTVSIGNSTSNVAYYNNIEVGGVPAFSQVPVATKAPPSLLRQEEGTAIPTTGTWLQGSAIENPSVTLPGATSRLYCTVAGTADVSVTGSPTATTDGATNTVTFSSISSIPVGCYINIAGAWTGARKVNSVDVVARTGVVAGAVPAAVSAIAVTYVAPTWVRGAELPEGWTTYSDANYTALVTDRVIAQIGTLTAARPVTLPLAASVPKGYSILIQDDSGSVTNPNCVQIACAGSDTINGTSATRNMQIPYGRVVCVSDGVSNWTYDSAIPIAASTTYTPILKGATDDPVATYATQVGQYILIGKVCYFTFKVVTSTMTKTTLTDVVRMTLPFTSVNRSNQVALVNASASNATPVQNANVGYINPNVAYTTFAQLGLTTAQTDETYAITSLGVLTNTITFSGSGTYEIL